VSERAIRMAVIDYGAGNLRSVARALALAGGAPVVVDYPAGLRDAEAIVIPGVGAFAPAMTRLQAAGLVAPIREAARCGLPLVGLCLGMQLLFEESEEGEPAPGLGLIPGRVRRLPFDVKVPHMGWNTLEPARRDPLLAGLPERPYVYFVHSYVAVPRDRSVTVAHTSYGTRFPSVVRQGSVWGLQFHPEKSSRIGAHLLRNLVSQIAAARVGA
jgi:glutamine amidotransferase